MDSNGNVSSIPMNVEVEKREDENFARSGEKDRERELMEYYEAEFIVRNHSHLKS